jgi:hypothetical protein
MTDNTALGLGECPVRVRQHISLLLTLVGCRKTLDGIEHGLFSSTRWASTHAQRDSFLFLTLVRR